MTVTLVEAPIVTAPTTAPALPGRTPRLRRMPYEPAPGAASRLPRPRRSARAAPLPAATGADHAAVRATLACVIRLALEVLDGRRPTTQLAAHFDAAPRRYWQAAAGQRRTREPSRVMRMVLCVPQAHAAEVATVCEIDGRVRALAARFERTGPAAAWRCTALRLG